MKRFAIIAGIILLCIGCGGPTKAGLEARANAHMRMDSVNADLAENTWYYITAVSFQNGSNHEIYINGEIVNATHTGDNDVGIADGNVPLTISSAWCADGNRGSRPR